MDLRKQLLAEHSRANCDKIVRWVGGEQDRFDALFDIFCCNEYRLAQRAAWPVSYAVEAHPALIKKQFKRLVENMEKAGVHVAVKRNSIRVLQDITIPKNYHGRVMNACFAFIADPAEAAAVKAFAIRVLENLADQYPDIIPELTTTLEESYANETPAFRSRANAFFKKMAKRKGQQKDK